MHVAPPGSGDNISQDSDSYEKHKSSSAPYRQELVKSQAQQAADQATIHYPGNSGGANGKGKGKARQEDWAESGNLVSVDHPGKSRGANVKGKVEAHQEGWVESSNLAPVDTTTSVSESGMSLAPPSLTCVEH